MFGIDPPITPLERRKQFLIAESDLNRIRILNEGQEMADGLRVFTGRVKTVGSIALAGAALAAGVAVFIGGKPVPPVAKPSWLHTIVKGAQIASSIWFAFRARSR